MCLPNSVSEFVQNSKNTLAFNCAHTVTDTELKIVELSIFQSLPAVGFYATV